jgi:tripartite-type tricarboxylate transporter receptor subunit TctC
LAVASEKRLPALPDVPTFKEAGAPMLASAWYGLMLPAKAPADVVVRLNTEVNKILRNPEIITKLTAMGAIVMGGTSQEFSRFAATEIKRYEGIVKDSGAPKE